MSHSVSLLQYLPNLAPLPASRPPLWPCGMLGVSQHQQNYKQGNITLVLMHSNNVNGHKLLCDAHTVLEQHRITAALFVYSLTIVSKQIKLQLSYVVPNTLLLCMRTRVMLQFFFLYVCHSDSPISFLGYLFILCYSEW